jgi:hypothetical protein
VSYTGVTLVVCDAHPLQTLRLGSADIGEHAKVIEEGAAGRAEVFGAGFIAREVGTIQKQDTMALPRQQNAHRRTSRASANHHDLRRHLSTSSRCTR